MGPAERAAVDGAVGIDAMWKRRLAKLLAETPIASSLSEAVRPLVYLLEGVDADDLEAVIDEKRTEWRSLLYTEDGGFRLPLDYRLDFAVAIHLYTLADPPVFGVVNKAMFNPTRRTPTSAGISPELLACMPYSKFLDAALDALPAAYVFSGEVFRGVRWVYPCPERHDPKSHFVTGATVMWYEFKSTSREREVMSRPH